MKAWENYEKKKMRSHDKVNELERRQNDMTT